jgi:hypothetical protein
LYLLKSEACFAHWDIDGLFLLDEDDDELKEFYEEHEDQLTNKDDAFDYFLPKAEFYDKKHDSVYKKAKESIGDFFNNKLYYVGPLRADPKENNDATSQYKGVGYRGEYTAECYILQHNLETLPRIFGNNTAVLADYDSKITERLRDLAEGKTIDKGTIRMSLYEWVNYIGLADDVSTDNKGELIIKQGNGQWSSLKNVGVGVSQALPIILQCIVAPPDSTIIIEQPELHLHPKMQSRLADFFLAMSLLGKQIIIETHSEYIIDKLRLRIVQASSAAPINDKVAIYFAEKKDGYSEFRRIHINEYSVMSDWPEGFFEESMQIARDILFAARQKEKESDTSEEDND